MLKHRRPIQTALLALGTAFALVSAHAASPALRMSLDGTAQPIFLPIVAAPKTAAKKLLETGWNSPTPAFIKSNIASMQLRPFDGVVVRASGPAEVFTLTPHPDDTFAQDRADLAAIPWGRLTDNFIIVHSGIPSAWDWFDDAHWAASEANMRQYARLAKAGKFAGILFDPEPYLSTPWRYAQQPRASSKTFAQYQAQARARGARLMQVVQQEYPGTQLLAYYLLTANYVLGDHPSDAVIQTRLKDDPYGLWISFVNGMLDAAASNVTFIEGNEPAYYYLRANDFDKARTSIKTDLTALVEPQLRKKYAAQVRVAHSVFADGVMNLWNSPRFCGYYAANDADRLKLLEHNVYHALRSADRYAWFYNENMDWWGTRGNGAKIPAGMQDALESAREKIAAGKPLGYDFEPTAARIEAGCAARITVGGEIHYSDNTGSALTFDVKIVGKHASAALFCVVYNDNHSYECIFPSGSNVTLTPVRAGYRFEPPSRTYTHLLKNDWSDFTAIPK